MHHQALILSTTVLLLAGCSTTPQWDTAFGQSVREAQAAQLVDPAASARTPPREKLDGKAVAGVLRDYAEYYGFGARDARPPAVTHVNPR